MTSRQSLIVCCFVDYFCGMDIIATAARVHRGPPKPSVLSDTGAEAGLRRLAIQQLRVFYGVLARAPDEHISWQECAQRLPAAPHAVCHQPQR